MCRKLTFYFSLLILIPSLSVFSSSSGWYRIQKPGWSIGRTFKVGIALVSTFSAPAAAMQVHSSDPSPSPNDPYFSISLLEPYVVPKDGRFHETVSLLKSLAKKARRKYGFEPEVIYDSLQKSEEPPGTNRSRKNIYIPSYEHTTEATKDGKLIWEDEQYIYSCTGSMVSHKHVSTNGHCSVTEKKDVNEKVVYRSVEQQWFESFRFHLNYYNGVALNSSPCKKIYFPLEWSKMEDNGSEKDVVLCELEDPLGYINGWKMVENLDYGDYQDIIDEQTDLLLVHYSGYNCSDTPCFDRNCHIIEETTGTARQLRHDCSMTHGASGGGITRELTVEVYDEQKQSLQNYTYESIVAINHAEMVWNYPIDDTIVTEYSKTTSNLAVASAPLYFMLAYALHRDNETVVRTDWSQQPPLPVFEGDLSDYSKNYGLLINPVDEYWFELNTFIGTMSGFIGGTLLTAILVRSLEEFRDEKCCSKKKVKAKCSSPANRKKIELKKANDLEEGLIDSDEESMDVE